MLFHPLLDTCYDYIAREYFVADVLLMLDGWLGDKLLNPGDDSKLTLALEEGVKVRMLFALLRKSIRNAGLKTCWVMWVQCHFWVCTRKSPGVVCSVATQQSTNVQAPRNSKQSRGHPAMHRLKQLLLKKLKLQKCVGPTELQKTDPDDPPAAPDGDAGPHDDEEPC